VSDWTEARRARLHYWAESKDILTGLLSRTVYVTGQRPKMTGAITKNCRDKKAMGFTGDKRELAFAHRA